MTADNLLGEFLKARRGLVDPGTAGVRTYGGRRRVTGLRREELAGLAGVSTHYLIRLEQGRDRHPSPQVLDALAAALQLDEGTTAHLHALAADRPVPAELPAERLAPGVQELIDSWAGVPAYVRGRRLDVLASNQLAVAISPMYRPGRNLARDLFLDPAVRQLFPDWESNARSTVAALRALIGPRPGVDPLVAELTAASPDFARLWQRHDSRPIDAQLKDFLHPVVGPITLRRQALAVTGGDGQLIVTYQAEPGSPAGQALAQLAASLPLSRILAETVRLFDR